MDNQLLEYLLSFLTERRQNLFDEVISKRTRHFTVVTEDVYQLHNTSAVMRSCDVFGIQDLHVIEEMQGKDIDREIAMGAQKWVNIHRHKSTLECIDTMKEKGYQIIATSPHNDSTYLKDFDVKYKSMRDESIKHRVELDERIGAKEKRIAQLDKELELIEAKMDVLELKKKNVEKGVNSMSIKETQQEANDLFGD